MSIDSTGNFFNSSISLDATQEWQSIQDTVSFNNTNDYYSVQLSNRSSFELVLNDLSDNADVRLLNDTGSVVASSSRRGIGNEKINRILDAGTYFIEVHQVDNTEISYGLEYRNNYIPEGFQFNTEAVEGGIKLTNTKIFDADGADDIQKVDFWLKKQGGYWKKYGTVSEFSDNADGSIGFDYGISNLEVGEYYIWGRATDKFGARSNGLGKAFFHSGVQNVAPTNLSFTTESISKGIKLNNTRLYDANGIDDLEKIDFQLKKDDGEWIDIDDVVDFKLNQDNSIGFDYSITGLEAGNYQLRATAYDKDGANSEALKSFFQVQNIAPTDFRFEIETTQNGIRLVDTKVSDIDGINDLNRVDFWLKKDGGNWQNIDDAVEFHSNGDESIGFNYSINSLEKGNYVLWARVRDNANDYSNSWQGSFTLKNTAPTQLDFNLQEINGGIQLNNTKVFDADGIEDLEKIDFQLKQDNGEWIEIEDALNFSKNQDGSIGFNYSITGLEQGNYQLRATAVDKAGETSETLTSYFKVNNQVNNIAPTDFHFDIETIDGGVRVINTKVSDMNGIDDLTRVDFWLQKDDKSWENIADATEFRSNEDGTFSFDYSIDSLAAGDYVLWARTRDRADSYSNVSQKSFQVIDTAPPEPEQDWFDKNIQDESIRTLTRSLFSDNTLDRNDTITILRNAKDYGAVDAVEITDLRTLVDNASYLGISDYVKVLSSKVVYGDNANKSGNLQAGSSDTQLDSLINKWFYGSDRPETSHTYRYAQGSLFQNGISLSDINQGYINNCFFLAGLGATLVQSPEIIQNMFIDNGDGTFTVRFYNNGVADYVTVDRYLPTNNAGNFVYANPGDNHADANNELWVVLAEKAYAQLNESGWINQDGTNSYNGIGNAGYLSDAFAHITGEKSALGRLLNFDRIVDAFNSGEVIGFGSRSSGTASNIVNSHAYALVDYNASTQKFTLLNPWETDNTSVKARTLELGWEEISSNFSYWDSTISNIVST